MKYTLESGKVVNIPDKELEHYKQSLQVSEAEAIQIYLEDEGILHNPEQEELCKKAKENRVTAKLGARSDKPAKPRAERETKPQPEKELIISIIAKALQTLTPVSIDNPTKIITFAYNGNDYKVDLTQKRKPKGN